MLLAKSTQKKNKVAKITFKVVEFFCFVIMLLAKSTQKKKSKTTSRDENDGITRHTFDNFHFF